MSTAETSAANQSKSQNLNEQKVIEKRAKAFESDAIDVANGFSKYAKKNSYIARFRG